MLVAPKLGIRRPESIPRQPHCCVRSFKPDAEHFRCYPRTCCLLRDTLGALRWHKARGKLHVRLETARVHHASRRRGFLFFCVNAAAQEGYYGAGHDKWHQGFYSQLRRNDGGLCCNLMDCRPTQSRIVGDHYEVKVDGVWTPVPYDKINNVVAPDGGAHVCAPRQVGPNKGIIFCVILPSEG